ncbi:MAG: hypothetical protein ABFR47_08930, partial [Verrucomicrobiota bacterium]
KDTRKFNKLYTRSIIGWAGSRSERATPLLGVVDDNILITEVAANGTKEKEEQQRFQEDPAA